MMKKRMTVGLGLLLCLLLAAGALAAGPEFTVLPTDIRPGKTQRISFYAPQDGSVRLTAADGKTEYVLRESLSVAEGVNHLSWDGRAADGTVLPQGAYVLRLAMGDAAAEAGIQVGLPAPQILSVSAPDTVSPGDVWSVKVKTSCAGTLTLSIRLADNAWHIFAQTPVEAGESTQYWNGQVDGAGVDLGDYAIQLRLTDGEGYEATPQQIYLTVQPEPTPVPTPAPTPIPVVIPSAVTTQAQENSYWTLPEGVLDEAAIWEVMMQPITVIEGDQKDVYRLRATPDKSQSKDNVVGEITCASQGVHVLETLDNGWTLVEVYNSSYGPDCASRRGFGVTDDLIRGYVQTGVLKQIEPRTDYALLIDKLNQTMYIFSEGKCIGTLLVSTGLNNSKQSWNETPSGEFLMVSRMGGFPAGNLWCAYGMRVNGGCAIHEVPYIGNADTPAANRDYSSTVKLLGKKASHGCIRVQKALNENGQNIKWLWDNIRVNTKVLIWDDTGRFRAYPDDDLQLYYNPNGGRYYHEDQRCSSVRSTYLPLTAFSYSELDTVPEFQKLVPCSTCAQIMRKTEIDALNAENGF